MDVEVQVNNSAAPGSGFLGWAPSPSPCRVRVMNPSGSTTPTVNVRLAVVSATGGRNRVPQRDHARGPRSEDAEVYGVRLAAGEMAAILIGQSELGGERLVPWGLAATLVGVLWCMLPASSGRTAPV